MSQRDGAPARPRPIAIRGKTRFRKWLSESFAGAAVAMVRTICATLRIETEGEEAMLAIEGGKILCLWHSRTIPPMARYRDRGWAILISLSRDGDLIWRILETLGYSALRGSTGPSGARVLASCIKLLRNGKVVTVTPDGPRGPSGVLQMGVVTMARKSGCPLVPLGSSARRRITMRSWDRFMIPLPFSRASILWGDPVYVPMNADEEAMETIRLRVETEMNRLQDEADRRYGVATWDEIAAMRPM